MMCTFTSIVCTDQWQCTSYLPMRQAGACIHVREKKNTCAVFINLGIYVFLTFFLLYFHEIEKCELK